MSYNKTIWAADMSPEMRKAAEDARKTFKYLWRELSWEYRRIIPGLGLSAVKVGFATDDGTHDAPPVEHMWVGEIQFDGEIISGVLLNTPKWTSTLKAGDPVVVPLTEIGDWMYALYDDVYGGFSVDLMRREMSPGERLQHDKAWGLNFPEPGAVRLIPPVAVEKKGLLSKLFAKKAVQKVGDDFPEHPMSENMTEKFAEGLAANPDLAKQVDGEGWTLLQREALAGNYSPAALLLKHGADAGARNARGMSALDLARKMDWPRIVALLEGV